MLCIFQFPSWPSFHALLPLMKLINHVDNVRPEEKSLAQKDTKNDLLHNFPWAAGGSWQLVIFNFAPLPPTANLLHRTYEQTNYSFQRFLKLNITLTDCLNARKLIYNHLWTSSLLKGTSLRFLGECYILTYIFLDTEMILFVARPAAIEWTEVNRLA